MFLISLFVRLPFINIYYPLPNVILRTSFSMLKILKWNVKYLLLNIEINEFFVYNVMEKSEENSFNFSENMWDNQLSLLYSAKCLYSTLNDTVLFCSPKELSYFLIEHYYFYFSFILLQCYLSELIYGLILKVAVMAFLRYFSPAFHASFIVWLYDRCYFRLY
jgi:hypothetical protein